MFLHELVCSSKFFVALVMVAIVELVEQLATTVSVCFCSVLWVDLINIRVARAVGMQLLTDIHGFGSINIRSVPFCP